MKLKESIGFKIAAIILSYVMILITIASAVGTFVMGYYKFYFSTAETVTQEILTDMAERETRYICTLLDKGTDLKSYYKDKNIFYTLTGPETGEIIDSNYSGEEYLIATTGSYGVKTRER